MPDYAALRRHMVETQLVPRGIRHPGVLRVMGVVPRELFVPAADAPDAYEDSARPIGQAQTISQPYVVALMLEALDPKPTDRVLEIGTGSAYATALLAELVAEVYTVERLEGVGDRRARAPRQPPLPERPRASRRRHARLARARALRWDRRHGGRAGGAGPAPAAAPRRRAPGGAGGADAASSGARARHARTERRVPPRIAGRRGVRALDRDRWVARGRRGATG